MAYDEHVAAGRLALLASIGDADHRSGGPLGEILGCRGNIPHQHSAVWALDREGARELLQVP